ncbi:MAG: SIS domain-containing protein [Porticoccaceae bacterium]|nr:SIS domain-containing protein [Porticoccaceae bacterium]
MKPAQLTQTISDTLTKLRKSERKVAEFVLKEPLGVIRMRIVDLAQQAGVSEPTVVRFCRAVGCHGFQDFKLALAQQLASSPSYGQIAVTDTDSTREYTHKVFDSTVDTLLKVRDSMVVAISQSGRTKALLDSMDLVKRAGGLVISLAPSNSPIARKADIAIEVNAEEDIQIYTPLSSRIAHLAVLDVLAIGVAQKKGPQLEEHLQQLQAGLASLRSQ